MVLKKELSVAKAPDAQPRLADENRRDQVAQAACRVIAREGLDRASMRAIAHELGCTTGVLTHYFRDKDALLDFVLESIAARLQRAPDPSSLTTARGAADLAASFLPVNAESRLWWVVWLSFTAAAMAKERQSANHARLYAGMKSFWHQVLKHLIAKGTLPRSLDPDVEADLLLSLIDGIGLRALISPATMTKDRQIRLITSHFVRLARE